MSTSDDPASTVQLFADRVCDWTALGFALWTICAYASVLAGFGLDTLLLLAGGVLLVAAGARLWAGEWAGEPDHRRPAPEAPTRHAAPAASGPAPPIWMRLAVAAGAAACAAAAAMDFALPIVWSIAAVLVAAVAGREVLRGSASTTSPKRPATPLLVLLALACGATTLVAHRPDVDDAFYLNLAVAAVDAPAAPLLANDTMHGVPDVPLALPVYRVHSIELLEAAVARLTGRPVLDVAHLWLPVFAALLVPFAYARSLHVLIPGASIWGVFVALGWMLFTATASHGWANFGLVRLHQGKGLLLTLALPLVVAYALEFARRGGVRAWLLLAAAQVGAVGLSASALWLAPAVAAPALLAGTPMLTDRASRRRLLAGLAASGYVVATALAVRAATTAAFQDAAVPSPALAFTSLELATQVLRTVLGPGVAGAIALFAAVGSWSFASNATTRRFCAFSSLLALLLWNPLIAQLIATQVTSAPAYWRVLWLLPMPVLIAVTLTAPIHWLPRRLGLASCGLAALGVFGALVATAPRAFVLSTANAVRLAAPGWKVPPVPFDAAQAIVAAAAPHDHVLAPRRVAAWIPTLHNHPAPLVVRSEYLPVLHGKLDPAEIEQRIKLMRLASGAKRPPRAEELMRKATGDERLTVVCLAAEALRWDDIVAVLRDAGFQEVHRTADHVVWARAGTDDARASSKR